MPSCNTYHLTWVSLTLGMGYLFTGAPAKHSRCSLPWARGPLTATVPDLQRGIAPLGPPVPVQLLLLGMLLKLRALALGMGGSSQLLSLALGSGWPFRVTTPGLGAKWLLPAAPDLGCRVSLPGLP